MTQVKDNNSKKIINNNQQQQAPGAERIYPGGRPGSLIQPYPKPESSDKATSSTCEDLKIQNWKDLKGQHILDNEQSLTATSNHDSIDVTLSDDGEPTPGAEHFYPGGISRRHQVDLDSDSDDPNAVLPSTAEEQDVEPPPAATVAEAYKVEDDPEFRSLRQLVNNAPIATAVKNEQPSPFELLCCNPVTWTALIICSIAIAVGVGIVVAMKPEPFSPPPLGPTLERIQKRGRIRCHGRGVGEDLCSALAAAFLGDATKYEIVSMPFGEQFHALTTGKIDVSTDRTTPTIERDIVESSTNQGMTFTTPYLYGGGVFYGLENFVACADRGDTLLGDCRDLSVCVKTDTVWADLVQDTLPATAPYKFQSNSELLQALSKGLCNVIASSPLIIYEELFRLNIPDVDQYVMAVQHRARDPIAMTTRNDDTEFGDMVNWVLQSLIVAEAMNISKANADEFPTTDLFGDQYTDMFRRAIKAAGNYGDLYATYMEIIVPRDEAGINRPHLYPNDGGLLYPLPFGNTKVLDDNRAMAVGPTPGGTLEMIEGRGNFNCGILVGRPGFAQWNETSNDFVGIDVDYCRGLAASMFAGDLVDTVKLIPYESEDDGFVALFNEEIDVLVGAEYNIVNDIRQPTTGHGFSFGGIYFYHQEAPVEKINSVKVLAIATREDDTQWTDFVRSIVQSTIYAESKGISRACTLQEVSCDIAKESAVAMPVLELLGPTYTQAFQDVILSIGNYAEIYERNMERYVPRSENVRNTLNNGTTPMFFSNWQFA